MSAGSLPLLSQDVAAGVPVEGSLHPPPPPDLENFGLCVQTCNVSGWLSLKNKWLPKTTAH
eukprot:1910673-Pyramimonas_sp.AAC.1